MKEVEVKEPKFKIGDKVKPIKLVDYKGTKVSQYSEYYIIAAINGDTATLETVENDKHYVWAIMKLNNLKKEN